MPVLCFTHLSLDINDTLDTIKIVSYLDLTLKGNNCEQNNDFINLIVNQSYTVKTMIDN